MGSANVTVINSAGSISTLPVGNGPSALVVNPVTNAVYVANRDSNTVSVSAPITPNGVAPLTTVVTGYPTVGPGIVAPTINFTTTSSYAPNVPPVRTVFYRTNLTPVWTQTSGSGPFTATLPAQLRGEITVQAVAVDALEAGFASSGGGGSDGISPILGAMVTQHLVVSDPLAQTIVFGANPGPLIYAPSDTFAVNATGGGSGNPVTFTSNTSLVCTAGGSNGATVTIVTAGLCTIAANQAGSAAYNAAPEVTQSITIIRSNQATLTATASSTSLTVGQTATLGSTGGSGTGALSFASNNANCTVSGTTLTAAAAGGCTITATKAADTNYNAASSAALAITTLPQQDAIFASGFEQ